MHQNFIQASVLVEKKKKSFLEKKDWVDNNLCSNLFTLNKILNKSMHGKYDILILQKIILIFVHMTSNVRDSKCETKIVNTITIRYKIYFKVSKYNACKYFKKDKGCIYYQSVDADSCGVHGRLA